MCPELTAFCKNAQFTRIYHAKAAQKKNPFSLLEKSGKKQNYKSPKKKK